MECKYSGVCRHLDGCSADGTDPMECWAYNAIEGLVNLPFTQKMEMTQEESECFPDEILYNDDAKMEWKLFLERSFYSDNFKDSIFIRYISVDQAMLEEEPENSDV